VKATKPKMGRPPLPKKLQKGALLSVRFSEDERAELERAADREGASLSDWARRVLLQNARNANSAR
jgi:hypothetical protein